AFDSPEPSAQLQMELRRFSVTMTPEAAANVELVFKVVEPSGKISDTRAFEKRAPLKAVDSPSAVAALDAAFGSVLAEAMPWITSLPIEAAPAKDGDGDGDFPDFPEPPPAEEPGQPEAPAPPAP